MTKVWMRLMGHVKINQVIQYLTYSDILMLSGWGLVNPIMAVFFTNQIQGGSVELAGMAATVYFIVKSLIQVPIARYNDARKGEWDDYWVMIVGSLLITLSAFMFAFIRLPVHVLLVQVVAGIGGAMTYPSWLAIFTRHIDKHEEALEWSLYYTATDLGAALTAGLGGFIAGKFGYNSLFLTVGVISLIGTGFLAGVGRQLKRR